MRNHILSYALLALVATSAPTVQGHAQDELASTARVDSAAQDAFAGGTLTLQAPAVLEAAGCCDQGYKVKRMLATGTAAVASAFEAAGCCDQGYEIKRFSLTHAMVALIAACLLGLAITYNRNNPAQWTSPN